LEIAPGVKVTATPAQHFTARTPWDRNRGHWCGWIIEGAGKRLWHAGDSAWCPAFEEIGRRFSPIDLGMIPIGAYNPRAIMESVHVTPEEAVDVFKATGCKRAIAMHWGTFRLTDEPMSEPPARLKEACEKAGITTFNLLPVGGGLTL
jgi:N-acyl-phosphatidylethanolamine-hydrolysing phospholipase D